MDKKHLLEEIRNLEALKEKQFVAFHQTTGSLALAQKLLNQMEKEERILKEQAKNEQEDAV